MSKRIKFSVGNERRGYKSVEIFFDGTRITYKILRNEFNPVEKNPVVVNVPKNFPDELNLADWEKIYRDENISGGDHWSLTFADGKKVHHSRGINAYPETWDVFADWIDELIPEINFVDGKRIDSVEFRLSDVEKLSLSRDTKTLTLEKISSTHNYRLGRDDTKNFLEICQKYFDTLEIHEVEGSEANFSVKLSRHDNSTTEISAHFSDFAMPGIFRFVEEIHAFAADLSAEIFNPEAAHVTNDSDKIILCKVQFKGTYKNYTYRAEDETLAVGDVVDVPVGRNNDVTQAKIVDIGYFDVDEAPIPLEKIKIVIGKHVGNAWDNY